MIIDKIENISKYNQIPSDVADFLTKLDSDINVGKYDLAGENYVNVEIYTPKSFQNALFESHKNYADIQLLLDGREKIYYTSVKDLIEHTPYNEVKDISFYKDSVINSDYVTLNGTNFVMIFPHEAHAPQVAIGSNKSVVKKVVAKIKI